MVWRRQFDTLCSSVVGLGSKRFSERGSGARGLRSEICRARRLYQIVRPPAVRALRLVVAPFRTSPVHAHFGEQLQSGHLGWKRAHGCQTRPRARS